MSNFKFLLSLLIFCAFSGCVSSVLEGGHIAVDEVKRTEYLKDARAGDREAQFKLGEAFCCSTDKSGAAYDTTIALYWLCASARQGYAPAMYKVGKIYTGDVIDGIRLLRRATTGLTEAIAGDTVSMPVGYAWMKLASKYGEKDAAGRLASVKSSMNASDLKKGEYLASQELSIPCEMKEVF